VTLSTDQLRFQKKEILFLVCILLITCISFSPVLKNGFSAWDDTVHLTENPLVQSLDSQNIQKIFQSKVHRVYMPLTTLSFAIEYHFFKYKPLIYHLNNLLLHLGIILLVYLLARQLGLNAVAASVGTILFAIHPMHVESVAWVSERKDVLYAFFYLLAMNIYWRFILTRKLSLYLGVVLLGFCSMLSKPMAVSLPLALCLLDWFAKRKDIKMIVIEKIPFVVYTVWIALFTYSENKGILVVNEQILQALCISVWSFTFYLKKFFSPFYLAHVYAVPKPIVWYFWPYLSSFLILAVGCFSLLNFKKYRWFVFSVSFYILSICYLVRFNDIVDTSIVADRYMYLASLGICFFLGKIFCDLVDRFPSRRIAITSILFILIAFSSMKSFSQSQLWGSDRELWTNVINRFPNIHYAYLNRGTTYSESGFYDLALKDFDKAIELNPGYAKAYYNKGVAYARDKSYYSALNSIESALILDPQFEQKPLGKQSFRNTLKQFALRQANKEIDLNDQDINAYYARADIYRKMKRYPLAISDYQRIIEINPGYANVYNERGITFGKLGQFERAREDFDIAINLNPQNSKAYYNRSLVFKSFGDFKKAYKDALKAQSLGQRISERYLSELEKQIKK